jgi:cell division protein FtsL
VIRHTTALFLLLAILLSVALFAIKHQVRELEARLVRIDREIGDNQQAIHVLKAEWSHLNEPGRLKDLAGRHLGMEPVSLAQVQRLDGPPSPVAAETQAPGAEKQAARRLPAISLPALPASMTVGEGVR